MAVPKGKKDFLLKRQAKSYAGASTIHGLSYIAEEGRPRFESLLWLVFAVCSVVLCFLLISPIYSKWRDTPTYTSINTTNYPVWNMPFPGVTVCSNIFIDWTTLESVLDKPGNKWAKLRDDTLKLDNRTFNKVLHKAMEKFTEYSSDEEFYRVDNDSVNYILNNKSQDLTKLVKKVRHKCSNLFLDCRWEGKKINCTSEFETTRTDEGFCCSFNIVKIAEQFDEDAVSDENFWDGFWNTYGDYFEFDAHYFDDIEGTDDDESDGDENQDGEGDPDDDDSSNNPPSPSTKTSSTKTSTSSSTTQTSSTSTRSTSTQDTSTKTSSTQDTTRSTKTSTQTSSSSTSSTSTSTTEEADPNNQVERRKRSAAGESDADDNSTADSKSGSNNTGKANSTNLRHSNSASARNGLTVMIKLDKDEYEYLEVPENETMEELPPPLDLAKNDFYGVKVLIHSPYEFPEVGGKGFVISGGKVAYIGVAARVTTSTDTVKSMAISRRNCVKVDEKEADLKAAEIEMDIFKNYTRRSCLLECRAHKLWKSCGCLPYYFPNFGAVWNASTSCDVKGLMCLARHSSVLTSLKTDSNSEGADCYCPLECSDVYYLPELSQVQIRPGAPVVEEKLSLDDDVKGVQESLDQVKAKLADPNNNEDEEELKQQKDKLEGDLAEERRKAVEDMIMIHVYNKELGVMQFSRDELYSVIDFVAAAGGLIGLCMGFSLLSGLEIIYWFTIRMWNDHNKKQKATWPQPN